MSGVLAVLHACLGLRGGFEGRLSLDGRRVASALTWLSLGRWWAASKGTSLVESRLPATWPAVWNWAECQDCRWGRWMHFGVSHWVSGGPVCPRWPPSAPEELLATSSREPGGCDWCLGTCPKPGPGSTVFSAPHSSQLGRGAPVPLLGHVACSGRAEGLSRFVCRKLPQHRSPPPHPWAVTATPATNSPEGPEPWGGRRPTWLRGWGYLEGLRGCDWVCEWPAFWVHVCSLTPQGSFMFPWPWFMAQAWRVGEASTWQRQ